MSDSYWWPLAIVAVGVAWAVVGVRADGVDIFIDTDWTEF